MSRKIGNCRSFGTCMYHVSMKKEFPARGLFPKCFHSPIHVSIRYTESTAIALAKEALAAAGENGRVACVSCPTLYKALVDVVKDEAASGVAALSADSSTPSVGSPSSRRAIVLEFDRRFAKWGADFVFYDYKDDSIPELPVDWRNSFDVVVCDPPFLTEDCAAATLKAAGETLGKKPLSTSTSTALS